MLFNRNQILFNLIAILIFSSCNQEKKHQDISPSTGNDSLIVINTNPYKRMDQSPMDMIYCPSDYSKDRMQNDSLLPYLRIVYSRPHVKGRKIFGDEAAKVLCPYGKPWRLGANEATEIEIYRPMLFGNQNIAPGRYTMYAIPYADHWTIIINKNVFNWGLQMDSKKDLVKTDVPTQVQNPRVEDMTMVFKDNENGTNLIIAWDDVFVQVPFIFSK